MVSVPTTLYDNLVVFRMPNGGMTDAQFFEFCQLNNQLRIERNSEGQIIVMPPTGSLTGSYNSNFNGHLFVWNNKHRLGRTFDSSTGFKLPSGSDYSPDAAWVSNEQWNTLTLAEKQRFAPLVPEFIAEIRSPNDNLQYLRDKIEEFLAFGTQLAWLIDPQQKRTTEYRADGSIHTIPFEQELNASPVLPDFKLTLADIFEA